MEHILNSMCSWVPPQHQKDSLKRYFIFLSPKIHGARQSVLGQTFVPSFCKTNLILPNFVISGFESGTEMPKFLNMLTRQYGRVGAIRYNPFILQEGKTAFPNHIADKSKGQDRSCLNIFFQLVFFSLFLGGGCSDRISCSSPGWP